MTFLDLQDRVLGRLNLSTADARTRISEMINERLRQLQTSINMGRVRRASTTVPAPTGTPAVPYNLILTHPDGGPGDPEVVVLKPFTVFQDLNPVWERTVDQIRQTRANRVGKPEIYAVWRYGAVDCEVELYPVPDQDYTLRVEGLVKGLDLVLDADVPAFPEDFHDILIWGALANEYTHMDRDDLATPQERRYQVRLGELRYFIQKSIYLHRIQNSARSPSPFWWRLP